MWKLTDAVMYKLLGFERTVIKLLKWIMPFLFVAPAYAADTIVTNSVFLVGVVMVGFCVFWAMFQAKRRGRNEEQIRQIINTAPYPMEVLRLSDGEMLLSNIKAVEAFSLHGRSENLDANKAFVHRLLAMVSTQQQINDVTGHMICSGGTKKEVLVSACLIEFEGIECALISFNDVTLLKEREDKLAKLSISDEQTGVMNQSHFLEIAQKELRRTIRYGNAFCVLAMDIDGHDVLLEKHGVDVSNKMMRSLAQHCEKTFREVDVVGRLEENRFVVIVTETHAVNGAKVAERLRAGTERISIPLGEGKNLHYSLSIGVAGLKPTDTEIHDVINRAECALDEVKEKGGNLVMEYHVDIRGGSSALGLDIPIQI